MFSPLEILRDDKSDEVWRESASPGRGNRGRCRDCEVVLSVAEEDLSYGQAEPLTSCRELISPAGFDPRGRRVGVPDFYLPDFGVYAEYWGLVGADRGYEKRMALKTERYLRNGVRVVSLYPGDLRDLGYALGSRFGRV